MRETPPGRLWLATVLSQSEWACRGLNQGCGLRVICETALPRRTVRATNNKDAIRLPQRPREEHLLKPSRAASRNESPSGIQKVSACMATYPWVVDTSSCASRTLGRRAQARRQLLRMARMPVQGRTVRHARRFSAACRSLLVFVHAVGRKACLCLFAVRL